MAHILGTNSRNSFDVLTVFCMQFCAYDSLDTDTLQVPDNITVSSVSCYMHLCCVFVSIMFYSVPCCESDLLWSDFLSLSVPFCSEHCSKLWYALDDLVLNEQLLCGTSRLPQTRWLGFKGPSGILCYGFFMDWLGFVGQGHGCQLGGHILSRLGILFIL